MAEHLNQAKTAPLTPFDNMGKAIGPDVRQRAFDECIAMGLTKPRAYECVSGMAEQLERDKPYEAQAFGMRHLDLTGTYRAMAVLLAGTQNADAANTGKSD